MDNPFLSPSIPRIIPPRTHSRTPSRSPTRRSFTDDILRDLSPASTLELFTSPSGKLKASIEAATPNERAFGIRATLASNKIQEWVDELSAWPWPKEGGFEIPAAKRRKLWFDTQRHHASNGNGYPGLEAEEPEYCGSILTTDVLRYEERIDDITADMEDLDVEEIKRQVLDTHFSPKSRPSSSASSAPMPSFLSSYTRMDDFTAIVTYTVLQSLPNLSRLLRLMDVWSIRLNVLLKVPPLTLALDDVEMALKSGWAAIKQNATHDREDEVLTRRSFEIMRNVLQDKVTSLGQDLDFMLDTLEGRQDTLPEEWLDRMESIELEYGNWVVAGDRKVREGEWAQMARKRKEEENAKIAEGARLVEAAQRRAEDEARSREIGMAKEAAAADMLRRKTEEERHTHEMASKEAEDARKAKEAEENAAREKALKIAEDARIAKEVEIAEIGRLKAVEEANLQALKTTQAAAAVERKRKQEEEEAAKRKVAEEERLEALKVSQVAAAAELKRKQEEEFSRLKAAEEAANKAREAELAEINKLKAVEEAQLFALKAAQAATTAEYKRKQEEEAARQKTAEEARLANLAQQMAEKAAATKAKEDELAEIARRQTEEARSRAIRQAEEAAAVDSLRRKAEEDATRERALQEAEDSRRLAEAELARQKAEESRLRTLKEAEELAAAELLQRKADEEAARERVLKEAEEELRLKATKEGEESAAAAELLKLKADEEAAKLRALEEAEAAAEANAAQAKAVELARKQAEEEATRLRAMKQAEDARVAELAKQKADEAAAHAKAAELARENAKEEAGKESQRKALDEFEVTQAIEIARLQADAEDLAAVNLAKQKARDEPAREKTHAGAEIAKNAATRVSAEIHSPVPLADASTSHAHSDSHNISKPTSIDGETSSTTGATSSAMIAGAGITAVSHLAKPSFSSPRLSKFTEHLDPNISELPTLKQYGALLPAVQTGLMEAAREPSFGMTKATDKPEHEWNLTTLSHGDDGRQTLSTLNPENSHSEDSIKPVIKDASPPSGRSPQFGHPLSNMLRQKTLPSTISDEHPVFPDKTLHRAAIIARECVSSHEIISPPSPPRRPQPICTFSHDGAAEPVFHEFEIPNGLVVEPSEVGYLSDNKQSFQRGLGQVGSVDAARSLYPGKPTTDEHRRLRTVYSHSENDLTDVVGAEPAEHFHSALSPTKSPVSILSDSAPTTPTQSSFPLNGMGEKNAPETIMPSRSTSELRSSTDSLLQPVAEEHSPRSRELPFADGSYDDCEACEDFIEVRQPNLAVDSRKATTTSLNSGVELDTFIRRPSTASSTSTVITNRLSDAPSSPIVDSGSGSGSFEKDYERSPTAGRAGLRGKSLDYSPPDSPVMQALPHLQTAQLRHSPSLDFLDPSSPSTPLEAPILESVEISNTPMMSSPKKVNTDDQIQHQISSILETIPARIQLNSSLNEPKSFTSESLRIQKTRRSITPSFRSSSSMSNYSNSSRATTPSFTLAPAYGKTSSRARPPTTNPDIKLYHLTRSTGEKAIKLHVRLVGEHGERVMVRVGGGWADLGEYLKAYASHHSRRGVTDTSDKIEIQDLPSKTYRVISNASTSSTTTIRGNGRKSPLQRPATSLSRDRPGSSLDVRKTRKSFGEKSERGPFTSRLSDYRSPSTPVPVVHHVAYDTPPSVATSSDTPSSMRSSSRMSWNEEDASLGLAGPKGKKVQISDRDQEWVDTMTEKVKLASAEKEREKEKKIKEFKTRDRKTSLGEMDKVGGTKRLFRKS